MRKNKLICLAMLFALVVSLTSLLALSVGAASVDTTLCPHTNMYDYENRTYTIHDLDEHVVVYTCPDCGYKEQAKEIHTGNMQCKCPCGYYNHMWNEDYTQCIRCGYIDPNKCHHTESGEIHYHISHDGYSHLLYTVCIDCGDTVSILGYENCTLFGVETTNKIDRCSLCSRECVHEWSDSIDDVKYCVKCLVSHSQHVNSQKVLSNGDSTHTVTKSCMCCGDTLEETYRCTYMNGTGHDKTSTCSTCGGFCTHTFNADHQCTKCLYTCDHLGGFHYENVTINGINYDVSVCDVCAWRLDPSNVNYTGLVNIYRKQGFTPAWNATLRKYNTGENAYWKFKVEDFSYRPNGTINLVGGFQYPDNVGSVKNARYVVMRVRLHDVVSFELDMWTSNTYVDLVPSNEMTAFTPIKVGSLVQDVFINLVIDLEDFSPRDPQYYDLGSTSTYKYMRSLLCATFGSADGYVDISYFATCNDMTEIEQLITSVSGSADNDHYVYDGSSFSYVSHTHNFKNENGKYVGTCQSCGYTCPHTEYTYKGFTDNLKNDCGYYKLCKYCKYDFDWTRSAHVYEYGSYQCTKVNKGVPCTATCQHNFKNANGKNVETCQTCGFKCTHDEYSIRGFVRKETNTCGSYKMCKFCKYDYDWRESPHEFANGSKTCTKSNRGAGCTYTCNHNFKRGDCTLCGWECQHVHLNGSIRCSICRDYIDFPVEKSEDGFMNMIYAIYDAQAVVFLSLLDYNLFGINIAVLLVSLFALGIAFIIYKKVK